MSAVRVWLANDDEAPGRGGEDVDRGVVEGREVLTGDDVSWRTGQCTAVGQVDDLTQMGQDRVDVVGDEDDGDAVVS